MVDVGDMVGGRQINILPESQVHLNNDITQAQVHQGKMETTHSVLATSLERTQH
jgi:hypothetical protein